MYFTGNYRPRLDDKSRLVLPARFREALTGEVVVAPGQDRCLQVWSQAGFEESSAALRRKSQTDRETRRHIRFLFGLSSQETADKQGRIGLNSQLREFARITDRDVVVTGVLDHVEIWAPEQWDLAQGGAEDEFADLDGAFGFVDD
ncbi:transcriptional regulator MraZ [Marmoricola endophyticus]|uniref:Transcriptional regulator MraZ n=1 Tax=Marmoricola endophyticus TaxID=2040280 RepID=A0A917BEL9_9ACTN|nr:division/cell wall cluster transcriptional repressor MraZ [Marmoricola endophyticus]GGF38001.1 transcriptional regulator MraZ [Marmoricola endophyticus]